MSAPTDRPAVSKRHPAAPARNTGPTITGSDQHSTALVVLIVTVVVMAILPNLVQYLNVQHVPESRGLPLPRVPISSVTTMATSAALFLVCWVIFLMRGHRDRNVSGATILLLGLVVPYIISSSLPESADLVRAALAAAIILAAWNIGAPVDMLKWIPITGSLVGVYSLIGGLIAPEYMMYTKGSSTTLVSDWQLAGPFAHCNLLGIYCVLALALIPFIVSVPWRILNGFILCAAIVASSSRSALLAAGVLALWWIICRSRSVISVRLVGTVLIGCCAAAVSVLPFLSWKGYTFTGRTHIWAASLMAWKESPWVGLGVNWFTAETSVPHFARLEDRYSGDAFLPSHGHNLVVDTLVRSGLVGLCVTVLVLVAATRSIRAFKVSSHQIACFGYLIAFLVVASTETVWGLPTVQLFPVGLVFAVVIVARHDVREWSTEQSTITRATVGQSEVGPVCTDSGSMCRCRRYEAHTHQTRRPVRGSSGRDQT
jgi:O-antigen ligase